jgi:hypothetical protein
MIKGRSLLGLDERQVLSASYRILVPGIHGNDYRKILRPEYQGLIQRKNEDCQNPQAEKQVRIPNLYRNADKIHEENPRKGRKAAEVNKPPSRRQGRNLPPNGFME